MTKLSAPTCWAGRSQSAAESKAEELLVERDGKESSDRDASIRKINKDAFHHLLSSNRMVWIHGQNAIAYIPQQ
jgi:hypothetical protein